MRTFGIFICLVCTGASAQQPPVFKSETKVVLIDAVVTGKKGEPVRDLTAHDFRIWEDNKPQTIQSFSLSTESAEEPRRLVLFFDDSGMTAADDAGMRQAAARFVDSSVGPTRLMAVVTFDGAYHVAQSFTDNAGKLKDALREVRLAAANPATADPPARRPGSRGPRPSGANAASVDARGLIQSVGYLAQNLNAVPGRKIVVLFSGGGSFAALQSGDLAGLAKNCNRSNVAVYPVLDTIVQDITADPVGPVGRIRQGAPAPNTGPEIQAEDNIPFTIAGETGGFVVPASNDLLARLEEIGAEQNQYYVLGYTPADEKEGTCHALRLKVDRSHVAVRSRSSYCAAKPQDLLAESSVERDLEKRAAAPQTGGQTGSAAAEIQAPFFYVASNVALVHVAMEIPTDALKFETQKGKQHAEVNILGLALASDGGIEARFSDIVRRDFDSEQEAIKFKGKALHYEKEFKIIPGRYNLTVAFSSGGANFGKIEMPLVIPAYAAGQFAVSGLALSRQVRPTSELGLEPSLMDEERPLIAGGMQLTPGGSSVFSRAEQAFCYFEVYTPGTLDSAATIGLRIIEANTGVEKWNGGSAKLAAPAAGKSTIPVGLSIPIATLTPGSYQFEVTASNGTDKPIQRTVDFRIE